jgi:hypothetical protein
VVVRPLRVVPPAHLQIVESGHLGEVSIEPPERRGLFGPEPMLGAAVDVGTTTIVVALIDLRTGETLGTASALNPQHPFGHDVISRISHAAASGVEPLRAPVVDAVEGLAVGLLERRGLDATHLREVAIAGNTTIRLLSASLRTPRHSSTRWTSRPPTSASAGSGPQAPTCCTASRRSSGRTSPRES